MTPHQLFDWATENIKNINFVFVPEFEYKQECEALSSRFDICKTIKGTQKFHAFLPLTDKTLTAKLYSYAEDGVTASLVGHIDKKLQIDEIKGFVICQYDQKWWLACVIQTFPIQDEVKVTFLYPSGPNPSFYYPQRPDTLNIPTDDVLMLVDPSTATGRTYFISSEESCQASSKLAKKFASS